MTLNIQELEAWATGDVDCTGYNRDCPDCRTYAVDTVWCQGTGKVARFPTLRTPCTYYWAPGHISHCGGDDCDRCGGFTYVPAITVEKLWTLAHAHGDPLYNQICVRLASMSDVLGAGPSRRVWVRWWGNMLEAEHQEALLLALWATKAPEASPATQ